MYTFDKSGIISRSIKTESTNSKDLQVWADPRLPNILRQNTYGNSNLYPIVNVTVQTKPTPMFAYVSVKHPNLCLFGVLVVTKLPPMLVDVLVDKIDLQFMFFQCICGYSKKAWVKLYS